MRQARVSARLGPLFRHNTRVMLRTRRLVLWVLPAVLGLATAGVFAAGFVAALKGRLGEPVDPSAPPVPAPTVAMATSAGGFRIVALGDSLTRGAGDAAGSGGYPERVAAVLRKEGRMVAVENLAIDGIETRDLLREVEDPGLAQRIAGANLILLSISGNDLSHSIPASAGAPGETANDPTAMALKESSLNLQRILSSLRSSNPSAPIRLLGLYNPFPESFDRRTAKETLLKWNVALEEASYAAGGVTVVPTADLFDERPDRLSADRFHPGPSGYGEIASRILSTLNLPAATPRRS
jgi:lysophospholipase L1-like esterase